jgi:predicted RecB family nuclease
MITDQTFLSFLNCRRKAFLQTSCGPGEQPSTERMQFDLDVLYRRRALEVILRACQPSEIAVDPISWAAIRDSPKVIVNVIVGNCDLQAHIHAAERIECRAEQGGMTYAPVLFVRSNRLTRSDKLLLAFQALALASVQGVIPPRAKVVHGDGHKVKKLKVEPLLSEVRRLMAQLRAAQSEPDAPRVTLNRHCSACEFRAACRRAAEAADDLSLLRGMSAKEIQKYRSQGVTTITQFSHTYRPGRRGKRPSGRARRHDHALQALAIREKKVYVMDSLTVPHSDVALYLDVEGVPDRDFYYLIGLIAVRGGVATTYSYWADDRSQEKANWDACARLIESFGDYTLYHYGRYELRFLDVMMRAVDAETVAAINRIRARSYNVLAAIYSHVYFPTYTNGLKDIGTFLGAKWSATDASGIQSVAWRLAWEAGTGESLKQELLRYNYEDCHALRLVTEFLLSVSAGAAAQADGGPVIASVEGLHHSGGYRFGKPTFFCPELAQINKCAYSDYQRERVYVHTSPSLRQSLRRKRRAEQKRTRVNEEVTCSRPKVCPKCGTTQIHLFSAHRSHKLVRDLRFTSSGVKRWVVRYTAQRYRCWNCMRTFLPAAYRDAERSGHSLASWVMYHHVALRQSHEDVIASLREVFGLSFGASFLCRLRPRGAKRYKPAYEKLKEKLRHGPLIHVDETKVQLQRGCGYVWAFTNLEEVVYVYTPARDGTILREMLDGFKGMLVSDFYSAYDAPKCAQQKCLIHLIRDINDDLFHSPFDEEVKELARRLVVVLKSIIDTINRYGLKCHYLHKHKRDVEHFFSDLTGHAFASEVATKYQKRLLKYQHKLFVFLDHDGVPWNNNNAENALKRFASRRKIIGASFSEKGLREYLLFLSMYQTCRNKHLSFLGFLRSGGLDLDRFG